jgi:hypothetical protein
MAVLDDVKTSKGYILGVLAFATAVGAFLTQVLHFKTEPTLAAVASFAVFVLFLSWLIDRSEKRQAKRLEEHTEEMEKRLAVYDETLKQLVDYAKETQLATLRIEMNNVIVRNPENHDTILKYAEKYFLELGGDWVQTDVFFGWAESENSAGRPVRMPPALMNNIVMKRDAEKNTTL